MRRLIATSLRRLEPPIEEPVDLTTVKRVLRFPSTTENVLIDGWMVAAREYFEDQTSRSAIATLYEYGLDAAPWGRGIELPRPPLLDVVSVVYDAADGEQTLDPASYRVVGAGSGSPAVVLDPFAARGRVELVYGATWPTITPQPNTLRIRFTAGYGATAADVPEIVKAVHYDLIRHFHRRPNEDLPLTTQTLLRMFRQAATERLPPERWDTGDPRWR